jgi:hypothetical protein
MMMWRRRRQASPSSIWDAAATGGTAASTAPVRL